jgi:CHAT domain-containing protein
VALGEEVARSLVDHYLAEISDPDFHPTRDIVLTPRAPDRPVPPQRLPFLGQILLPPAARQRIRALAPEALLVVPDGPLHKLPLEGLLLADDPQPRYVLDELPPITYVPALAVLPLLAERRLLPPAGSLSLLTVASPAYPSGGYKGPSTEARKPRDSQQGPVVLGLRGQLPPLRFSALESQRIRGCFPADRVKALEGAAATEKAVVAALAGRRIVHIAAHGFAAEQFDNLFGALALTPPPPGPATPDNDGFLSLHEIYRLPLQDCELAVLSACRTNVGPQPPLEAGVTLASGFLAAGARRVVASHWSVDDESTAELMGVFFEEVTAAARRGQAVSFAQALQLARQKVRAVPRWAAPYY